jgi:hypothetical protein
MREVGLAALSALPAVVLIGEYPCLADEAQVRVGSVAPNFVEDLVEANHDERASTGAEGFERADLRA